MKMTVDLKEHSYPIYIERGILEEAAERIAEVYQGLKIMIISDDRVYSYYGEALKKNLSEKYGLIYEVEHIDMVGYAKEHSLTCEEAGRKLRYIFFEELKNKYKANSVAIAHNENDVAETMMLNIFRGTGLDGLESIPLRRDFYIRPILCFEKSEILEYLKENNINYVDDSTNFTNDYKRNLIRNEMIPFIEKNFNENVIASMARLAAISKENNEYIEIIINDKYKSIVKAGSIDRDGFNKLHHYEKTIILRKFLKENLKLTLNSKTRIFKDIQGVNFCGYKINEKRLKIRHTSKCRMKRKLKRYTKQLKEGKITLPEIQRSIAGWLGYVKHADSYNLRKSMFYIEG